MPKVEPLPTVLHASRPDMEEGREVIEAFVKPEHVDWAGNPATIPYLRRQDVRQALIDLCGDTVLEEVVKKAIAAEVNTHDAIQIGWAAACFKLKALLDTLDEEQSDE